ncbi:MAG: AAA family ATPase [Eggerthellales bacterium]|nr:AAA family ATPase [Eggerthellales bacterium]
MLSELFVTHIGIRQDVICERYVEKLPVVRHLRKTDGLDITNRITILVGENGMGKSTLIEAIAVNLGFNPEGGTRNFQFATEDTHSTLCDALTIRKGYRHPDDGFFLRAEGVYNAASYIDELDKDPYAGRPIIASYGGISLHKQSHGESFLAIAENRFGGNSLYILDEPEAALSPRNVMRLMCAIQRLQPTSQFIIATHSPMLMALPGAEVLQLTNKGIAPVNYQDTEHFTLMRAFLNDPERYLGYLFEDEEVEDD